MNTEVEEKLIQQALEMDLEEKNKKISFLENANKELKDKYEYLRELKVKQKSYERNNEINNIEEKENNKMEFWNDLTNEGINNENTNSDVYQIPESKIKRIVSNKALDKGVINFPGEEEREIKNKNKENTENNYFEIYKKKCNSLNPINN